jgi:hypothetical protein
MKTLAEEAKKKYEQDFEWEALYAVDVKRDRLIPLVRARVSGALYRDITRSIIRVGYAAWCEHDGSPLRGTLVAKQAFRPLLAGFWEPLLDVIQRA